MGNVWTSLRIGARRRWEEGVGFALAVLGAVWLLTEVGTRSSASLDRWLDAHGLLYLSVAGLGAALGFGWGIYEPRQVSFDIPATNTRLTLKFGDLFKEDTDWLIGVNEFFDSKIGNVVSRASVHGQIICDYFGGDEAKFRSQVSAALQTYTGTSVARAVGESNRYDIGTTAVLDKGDKHIYLVAISRTDVVTNKALSSVPELWTALRNALQKVHERGNGQPLSLPLLGNGRANINLPAQHLLRLVVLALVDFAKIAQLPNSVNLVLHEDCFSVLDLTEIRRDWRGK